MANLASSSPSEESNSWVKRFFIDNMQQFFQWLGPQSRRPRIHRFVLTLVVVHSLVVVCCAALVACGSGTSASNATPTSSGQPPAGVGSTVQLEGGKFTTTLLPLLDPVSVDKQILQAGSRYVGVKVKLTNTDGSPITTTKYMTLTGTDGQIYRIAPIMINTMGDPSLRDETAKEFPDCKDILSSNGIDRTPRPKAPVFQAWG